MFFFHIMWRGQHLQIAVAFYPNSCIVLICIFMSMWLSNNIIITRLRLTHFSLKLLFCMIQTH